MKKKMNFQIRSKKDARYFAGRISEDQRDFNYFLPLMGSSGGIVTIRCDREGHGCVISSFGTGWQNEQGLTVPEIVEYLWRDRKKINAELRNPESEWYRKLLKDA